MKKLSKVLSLVLVVAMVFSLCVIGASAKSFTDTDKVTDTYKEAVDVVSDLGIIQGMTPTTFGGQGTLTRAQACAMIARMTLGVTTADNMTVSGVAFSDVPATFWGYKYVQYCATAGIVGGVGGGKFAPNANLTGYQFAKMLMAALGVDVSECVGANWAITTAQLYYKLGFSDVVVTNAPLTREAATQMVYDALFYSATTKTGYAVLKGKEVVGIYDTVAEAAAMAGVLNGNGGTTYTVSPNKYEILGDNLAYSVFGVDRVLNAAGAYGRPSTVYTAKTAALGTTYGWTNMTKTVAQTPVATFTTRTTEAEMFAALGVTGVKGTYDYYVNASAVYKNGVDVIANSPYADAYKYVSKNDKSLLPGTGYGVLTEVYATDTANSYIVVCIDQFFGTVTAVNKATTTAGRSVSITVDGTAYTFVTDEFSKGDKVVVTMDNGAVATAAVATSVTGKMTSYTSTGVYTVEGKTYQASQNNTGIDDTNLVNNTAVYYVDAYGYIIATDSVTVTGNYFYVMAYGQSYVTVGGYLQPVYAATVVAPNGTVSTVTVKSVTGVQTLANDSLKAGNLCTYTVNADGSYNMTVKTKGVDKVTKGSSALVAGGNTIAYANNATNFIYVDKNTDGTLKGTVTTVTGIANVASATGMTASCVDANNDGIVETVFVLNDGTPVGSTANYVYYLGTYSTNGTVVTYDVIVDGAKTTMTNTQITTGLSGAGMYTVANGTAQSANTTSATVVVNNGVFCTVNTTTGVYTAVSAVADAVPVYVISASAQTVDTVKAVDFTTATAGSYVVAYTNSVVTAIYLVVA